MSKAKSRHGAFTLVEILVVIAILAILAVVTFVVINPVARINSANDTNRKETVNNILSAISLYSVDNSGSLPTYGTTPAPLPTVTAANVMTNGAQATQLNGISPNYMTTIPTDPTGVQYRVGRLASGAAIVGITLSDGTTHTVSE